MVVSISNIVRKNMYNSAVERSNNAINNILKSLEIDMQDSQEEIISLSNSIEASLKLAPEFAHYFVVENSWTSTAKIAYINQDLAYITYRDTLGQVTDRKFTSKKDYKTWDWYIDALRLNKNSWSSPFYHHTQKCIVNTYFCPIHDSSTGETIAIWAVDVKMPDLHELLDSYMPYKKSFGYVLSNNGTYVAHPHDECTLKTYQEFDAQYQSKSDKAINEFLSSKTKGTEILTIDGEKSIVIYDTIPTLDASLAIVCPFSEVFEEVIYVHNYIWLMLALGLAFAAISILSLIYLILRPLRGFTKAVHAIATGQYNAAIPKVTSKDEIRGIYDALVYLQQSLEKNIAELTKTTAEAARIDSELLFARQIQQDLLSGDFSPYIDYPGLDLYAKLQPARAVGGDLYDFFIRDSKLFFAIADVSGKGIPASLFMAMVHKIFRVIAHRDDSPASIAMQLNRELAVNNKENMFVTMFIGVLDLSNGKLNYINAGHNPPLILADTCHYMEVEPSIPIAAFNNSQYTEYNMQLEDGQSLLLYTDGVVEAESKSAELYSEARLKNLAQRELRTYNSKDCIDTVYASVQDFTSGAEQSDDITMLCLSYNAYSTSFEKLEDIDKLQAFVETAACAYQLSNEQRSMIVLALEELIVNVLQYSSSPKCGLNVCRDKAYLKFTLIDSGIDFDPTATAELDINEDPHKRQPGGLGIHFAKTIFSSLEYRRINDLNVLYAYFSVQ